MSEVTRIANKHNAILSEKRAHDREVVRNLLSDTLHRKLSKADINALEHSGVIYGKDAGQHIFDELNLENDAMGIGNKIDLKI